MHDLLLHYKYLKLPLVTGYKLVMRLWGLYLCHQQLGGFPAWQIRPYLEDQPMTDVSG